MANWKQDAIMALYPAVSALSILRTRLATSADTPEETQEARNALFKIEALIVALLRELDEGT